MTVKREDSPEMTILRREFDAGTEMNKNEVAQLLKISVRRALDYLRDLSKEGYIVPVDWARSKGRAVPIYGRAEGSGKIGKKQPVRLSSAQKSAAYRARINNPMQNLALEWAAR